MKAFAALLAPLLVAGSCAADPVSLELVGVQQIWDKGRHNAFTGLARFKDRWYCVFREGAGHVSPDGAIRVLTSRDGRGWGPAALIRSDTADLRDPKVVTAPDGRLLLTAAGALHKPGDFTHQSYVWYSRDGRDWGRPLEVGDPNYWLWRITWHGQTAYGVGYECGKVQDTRLYRSGDGRKFETLVAPLYAKGYPNETALVFLPDGTALCLLRRDGVGANGLLGTAGPPYTDWHWADVGVRIGGPDMIRLPSGRLIAAVRLYDKKVRTALCAVDRTTGKVQELLALPSGGDTSYAGLVWHEGLLWVSYYSSHEGRTNIYLARVKVAGE